MRFPVLLFACLSTLPAWSRDGSGVRNGGFAARCADASGLSMLESVEMRFQARPVLDLSRFEYPSFVEFVGNRLRQAGIDSSWIALWKSQMRRAGPSETWPISGFTRWNPPRTDDIGGRAGDVLPCRLFQAAYFFDGEPSSERVSDVYAELPPRERRVLELHEGMYRYFRTRYFSADSLFVRRAVEALVSESFGIQEIREIRSALDSDERRRLDAIFARPSFR